MVSRRTIRRYERINKIKTDFVVKTHRTGSIKTIEDGKVDVFTKLEQRKLKKIYPTMTFEMAYHAQATGVKPKKKTVKKKAAPKPK